MLPIPKNILARFNEVLKQQEVHVSLAVKQRVASSTQNQAFNALLFLFRHVLKKDFGDQQKSILPPPRISSINGFFHKRDLR
jgi:hypothetical protein